MIEGQDQQILQVLVQQQLLTAEQATDVAKKLTENKGDVTQLLVGGGFIDEENLTRARATVFNLPYIDLREQPISREILGIVPESTAREHLIIAYGETEAALQVAMANPADRQIVEFIHKKVDKPVEVVLCSESSVRQALSRYQESLEAELGSLVQESSVAVSRNGNLSEVAEDLPLIRITDSILKHAILQGASDIHLEPLEDTMVVRYRVDGLLEDKLKLPKNVMAGLVARIKVLSGLKIDEHRLPQDGRFKTETKDYKFSFRVSILPVFNGEKIVMRLLDESGQGLTLEDIGMRPRTLEIFRQAIKKPHGMLLVTGPTGSGKTTTLYSAMKEVNTPDVNISTVEDPIEYQMPRINQTQVKPEIGLTFANGLRSLVRQDPDIIMVGEIRDQETASLAINAALTGHLVFSTLHTNSAAGAVPRLLDMKVEPFLISSTINVILAQRLVRRLCEKCRTQGTLDAPMIDSLKLAFDVDRLMTVMQREKVAPAKATWETLKVYFPKGCQSCNGGYKGRMGIYEIFEMTPSLQQLITSQTTAQQLGELARKEQDMVTMLEDGFLKVVTGVTTLEEVLRVAKE